MDATENPAAVHKSSVVLLPQKRMKNFTRLLPAIIARDNNAATTPATQMASRSSSSRKYGCHAYQAHMKKPLWMAPAIMINLRGRVRHPWRTPFVATVFASDGSVFHVTFRG